MKNPNTRLEFEFPVDRHTAQTLDVWTLGGWPGISEVSAESFVGNWVKARATAKALRRLAAEIGAGFDTLLKLEERLADELEGAQSLSEVPEPFTYALDCLADVRDCDDNERLHFIDTCDEYRVGVDFVAGRYGYTVVWRQGEKERAVTYQTVPGAELHFHDLCEENASKLERQVENVPRPGARQRLSCLAERLAA